MASTEPISIVIERFDNQWSSRWYILLTGLVPRMTNQVNILDDFAIESSNSLY